MNRESISEHGEYRLSPAERTLRHTRYLSYPLSFLHFHARVIAASVLDLQLTFCRRGVCEAIRANENAALEYFASDDTFADYPGTNIGCNISGSFQSSSCGLEEKLTSE